MIRTNGCPQCHHTPSSRFGDHGQECYCQCHDVADAAPELLAALKEAKETIRTWHDMQVRSWQPAQDDSLWELYDANSPEMKLINAALAKATGKEKT